jgi:ribosomal protein S18 acetylase RimI-like enzyme
MSLSTEVVDDPARLTELAPEWEVLARGGDGALFRAPGWLLPWFRAFGPALEATPHVMVLRDDGRLVGLAPFYQRSSRLAGMKTREIRLLGDAGPRPPALDLLVAPSYEERFAVALARELGADKTWDILDLAPLRDPSRARAYLAEKLDGSGRKAEAQEAGTTLALSLTSPGMPDDALPPPDPRASAFSAAEIDKGLATLRRLSRLEWAARDEPSPVADTEAMTFLQEVVRALAPSGRARLGRLDDDHGDAIAATLVLDDPPRAVCVALAVDPEAKAAWRLLNAEAQAARARGMRALDVVVGAADVEAPPLPVTQRRSLRLRAFNHTTAGAVARTYASLRRRTGAAREAPGAAAAGARAAWTKIREAAASVASYERLHLYRGQLWTRGIKPPEGLVLAEFSEADFDALPAADKASLVERLDLVESYCREKWRRGDLVVLARLAERPAGIAWCARSAVMVTEIGREVRPGPSECYIHDVFVSPDARGKNVAPAMLEDLARRLRERDVYRAWALIEPSNIASTRAFEKAAFTSVADVIHARMAVVDRLVIRPPDPEAKRLLGVT